MGRPVHKMTSIVRILISQIQDIRTCMYYAWNRCPSLPNSKLLASCNAITGYQISSDNSNSQQEMASYKQITTRHEFVNKYENHLINTTSETFKYANTVPTVLCRNSVLICGYIDGVHFCLYTKETLHNMSHEYVTKN